MPVLNALRAFKPAARLGGFAVAAQELGVTAGAVSRHVRLLEDRTGVPLFERRPRSLVLTPRGHDLLGVVSATYGQLETGLRVVLAPTQRSRLQVNVQTSLAIGWMLARLDRFHRDRPELELELSSPRYQATRGLHGADPAALPAETLIVSHTASDDWTDWFSHAGLRGVRPRRTIVLGSSLLPTQAALHGLGITLADLALIGDHLDAGRLVVLVGLPPLVRGTGYHVAYAPGRADDPESRAFRQWLLAEVAQTPDGASPVAAG